MDRISKDVRRRNMQLIRSKDTTTEVRVRKLVYSLGYRYRIHVSELPGKPDIVIRRLKKVIFVHGCFWHHHIGCSNGRFPKSNRDYWIPKLKRNVARDKKAYRELTRLGWSYLVVWECELQNERLLKKSIKRFLK
ncbi:DNA mismatch endonuclease Vsr [bacterium]|nr:DNA mismatch endonuclease Vsr [bacterium]MBU1638374.1 DNA mismatch endonuclease Vsr [bacterium]